MALLPTGTDFAAWACTVGYYEVLSYRQRRKSRHEECFGQEFFDAVAEQVAEMSDVQSRRQTALNRCLGKLDKASREFVLRCYTAGVHVKQVAPEIGRSVAGTYQKLWRVRKNLHKCIESELRKEDLP